MFRFLHGLNRSIANSVELYPYADFDTLCGLCLKLEAQGKAKYGSMYGESGRAGTWSKNDVGSKVGSSNNSSTLVPKNVTTPVSNPSARTANAKDTSWSKVRCFKCQGFGHYQNACPNKRVVTLREAVSVREEMLAEEERLGDVFSFEEFEDKGDEDVETYDAPIYDVALVLRTLQIQSALLESEQRDQIFHTKCQVKDKWCSLIIDGGSCTNAASKEMVTKLGLVTLTHPKPYALHWVDDGNKVKVMKQVRVGLTMGSYSDEVLCDVIPMDACHILLGRP